MSPETDPSDPLVACREVIRTYERGGSRLSGGGESVTAVADVTLEVAAGEAFNVGTGSRITINDLAETIREATDASSEIIHVEGREGDIDQSVANISRARKRLGFEPKYGTRAGLEAYLGC